MRRRSNSKPKITLPFWKQDGRLWYVEAADLETAIKASGHSEAILRRRLGAGFEELQNALMGKRLDGWTVSHIEWGLMPELSELPRSHSTP